MPATKGITHLYRFAVGEYDVSNPGANVLSVTSTATGDFDKKNLTTSPLRETWRSATAATTQEILIEANDLNTVVDCFAILNHNFTDLASIQLVVSNNINFLVSFTFTLTWNKRHIVFLNDLGQSFRYFKLKITDPTNPCQYLEIGKIIGGKTFYFTENEDITDRITINNVDKSYQMKTEGFFRASNERIKLQKLRVRFDKLRTLTGENDNYLNYKEMFEDVGETFPFLTIVDPFDPYFILLWGQLTDLPSFSYDINRYADTDMTIEEVF